MHHANTNTKNYRKAYRFNAAYQSWDSKVDKNHAMSMMVLDCMMNNCNCKDAHVYVHNYVCDTLDVSTSHTWGHN